MVTNHHYNFNHSPLPATEAVAVDPLQFQVRPKRRGVAEEDALCLAKAVTGSFVDHQVGKLVGSWFVVVSDDS